MTRTAINTGVKAAPKLYGGHKIASERNRRKWTTARVRATHRVKNGINDCFSYFHLVEELAHIQPWEAFTAAQLADWLNGRRPQFLWDAVTVGRILNDLSDTWGTVNPGDELQPLVSRKTWAGTVYEMTDYEPARVVLFNLIKDLTALVDGCYDAERAGILRARPTSPLEDCPSVMRL